MLFIVIIKLSIWCVTLSVNRIVDNEKYISSEYRVLTMNLSFFIFLGDSFRQQRKLTKQDILFGWDQTAGALKSHLCYTKRRWLRVLSPSCQNASLSKVDQLFDSLFWYILIPETNSLRLLTICQCFNHCTSFILLCTRSRSAVTYKPIINCVNRMFDLLSSKS